MKWDEWERHPLPTTILEAPPPCPTSGHPEHRRAQLSPGDRLLSISKPKLSSPGLCPDPTVLSSTSLSLPLKRSSNPSPQTDGSKNLGPQTPSPVTLWRLNQPPASSGPHPHPADPRSAKTPALTTPRLTSCAEGSGALTGDGGSSGSSSARSRSMPAGLEGVCPGPLWGPTGGGLGPGEARGTPREVGGVGRSSGGRAARRGSWEARRGVPGDVPRGAGGAGGAAGPGRVEKAREGAEVQAPGARRRPLGPRQAPQDPALRGRPLPPGGAGRPQPLSGGDPARPAAQPSDAQRAGGSRLPRPRAAPVRGGEEPPPSAPASRPRLRPQVSLPRTRLPRDSPPRRSVSAFSAARSRAGEGRLPGAPPHAAPAGDPEAGRGRLGRFHSPRGPGPPPRLLPVAPRRVRCRCQGSAPSLSEPRGLRGGSVSAGRGPGLPETAPPPAGVSRARAGAPRAEAGAAAQGRTRSAEEGVNGSGSDRDLGTRRAAPHPRRGSPGLQGGAAGDGWGGMGGGGDFPARGEGRASPTALSLQQGSDGPPVA